ncbi:deoxynucleoside kinase [Pelagibaculum spongiae]|uniref:Deoxyguanosine kinase n=1 Tax=Pelagibaculum spongiae TaxID=2080658 RepID=A0A2V1H2D4_9GAMM|nr:deoxynucleoside kinase [Pelagibaculum spongiae]PVZ72130.1 deoxyguanosine kinase [Pelagibaculum spongiae]
MRDKPFKLIAVEGNIGAGKSTLLGPLVDALNEVTGEKWQLIKEDVDENPEFQKLLAEFTKDPSARIRFQRFITNHRAQLLEGVDESINYVIERSLVSDLIFSQANLSNMPRPDGEDICYYYDIHDRLETYPKIDMVVYLQTNAHVCYERMLSRARESESGTPESYIELISDFHDCLLPHICRDHDIELATMDWDDFGCPEQVAAVIDEAFKTKVAKAA